MCKCNLVQPYPPACGLKKKWPLFVPHGRICLENWQDGDIIFVDVYVLDEFETLS